MSRIVDFDSFRAETRGEPVVLKIGGEEYNLPAGLPADVALEAVRIQHIVRDVELMELKPEEKTALINQRLGENADELIYATGRGLFGEDLFEQIIHKHRITIDELPQLIQMTFAAYNGALPRPNRATRRASRPGRSRSSKSG